MIITVLFLKTPALLRRKQFLPPVFSVLISRALNEKKEKMCLDLWGTKFKNHSDILCCFLIIFFIQKYLVRKQMLDFPGGPEAGGLPASAGDMGLITGLGRFHMLWNN